MSNFIVPDTITPVLGARRFKVPLPYKYHDHPYRLSGHRSTTWNHEGTTKAVCRAYEHSSYSQYCQPDSCPHQSCKCGLHMWYTLDEAAYGEEARHIQSVSGYVVAIAAGWGKVFFDNRWFRSEFAQALCIVNPEDIYVPVSQYHAGYNHNLDIIERVRGWAEKTSEIYNIPILPPDEALEYAETTPPKGFEIAGAWVRGIDDKGKIEGVDI